MFNKRRESQKTAPIDQSNDQSNTSTGKIQVAPVLYFSWNTDRNHEYRQAINKTRVFTDLVDDS